MCPEEQAVVAEQVAVLFEAATERQQVALRAFAAGDGVAEAGARAGLFRGWGRGFGRPRQPQRALPPKRARRSVTRLT